MIKQFLLFTILLNIPFFATSQMIDSEQSKVTFAISNMGFNTVEGSFTAMQGELNFDPSDSKNASFDVCIDAATVNTGNHKRDQHLRQEDFFYVEKYPNICFTSTAVIRTKLGFRATGQLTMKGVTKTVSIPFYFDNQQFTGTLKIKRYDYNIGSSGGFMVGKEVDLEIVCVIK